LTGLKIQTLRHVPSALQNRPLRAKRASSNRPNAADTVQNLLVGNNKMPRRIRSIFSISMHRSDAPSRSLAIACQHHGRRRRVAMTAVRASSNSQGNARLNLGTNVHRSASAQILVNNPGSRRVEAIVAIPRQMTIAAGRTTDPAVRREDPRRSKTHPSTIETVSSDLPPHDPGAIGTIEVVTSALPSVIRSNAPRRLIVVSVRKRSTPEDPIQMRPVVAHANGRPIRETTPPAHLTIDLIDRDLTPASTVARLEATTTHPVEHSIVARVGIALHSMTEPAHDGTTARVPRTTGITGDQQRRATTAIALSSARAGTTNGNHGRMRDMIHEANNGDLPDKAIATDRHSIAISALKTTTAETIDRHSNANHAGTTMLVSPVADLNSHLPSDRVVR